MSLFLLAYSLMTAFSNTSDRLTNSITKWIAVDCRPLMSSSLYKLSKHYFDLTF